MPRTVRTAPGRCLAHRLPARPACGGTGSQWLATPSESPRERAGLVLDVLEEERLCELAGSTGRRVGLAALETLLRLGYPYALEVTPELLAR